MPMFDLKDSEDIKLTECHTDSSTLVKGDGLKRLEVSNSSASGSLGRSKPKVLSWFIDHVVTSVLGLVVTVVGGYLVYWFGWTG